MSPFPRLARAFVRVALALTPLPLAASAQDTVVYPPDDARIVYSDFACAHVGSKRASFDRQLPSDWMCLQEQMSPGVRATFLASATHVQFDLRYWFAGFLCGGYPERASWEFGLIVDGVRRPVGERNQLYPLSQGKSPWIYLGAEPGPHQVTLVWPHGADVDLRGITLRDTREGAVPELLAPEPHPRPQLTIFGDSITHGLGTTHVLNIYPVRLGAQRDWNIVNLGFAGRSTWPSDAWLAAGGPTCTDGVTSPPDLLVLEIGSNDFHLILGVHTKLDVFETRYREWIQEFRSLRPTTPILVLTPIPRGDECGITNRNLEQYREVMRAILAERADPRMYLFEGRDLIAMPPLEGDPLYDAGRLHPSDAGALQIAERLGRFNLVRNAGFELLPLEGCAESAQPEPYLWERSGKGVSEVAGGPGGNRLLALGPSAIRTQVVHGLSQGDAYSFKVSGATTIANRPGRVTLEFLDAGGNVVGVPEVITFTQTTWRRAVRSGTAPEGALHAQLRLEKSPSSGQFLVDDLELTVAEF